MALFLDNKYVIDASGHAFSGEVIELFLYYSNVTIPPTSFTIQQYEIDNLTILDPIRQPYTITVNPSDNYRALLTIQFNYGSTEINFGLSRKITITPDTGTAIDIYLTVDYVNQLREASWTNASDIVGVEDIAFHGPFVSTTVNTILKAIYEVGLTAWNLITQFLTKYSFNDRYLSDIIDLAISANVALDPATTVITYNTDNTINTLITTYTGKYRSILRNTKLRLSYGYAPQTVTRLQKRTVSGVTTFTAQESSTVNMLNILTIDALDDSDVLLYNLAVITVNRTTQQYINPYLTDYDINSNPDPIADYKYYSMPVMTGWTVVA